LWVGAPRNHEREPKARGDPGAPSRRQKAVDQGQRVGNSEQRASLRDRLVDWHDAIRESRAHLRKPPIERSGLPRIAAPLQLDSVSDFGKNEDARSDLLDRRSSDPTDNVGMGARLRISEMTFVSSRNFTDRPDASRGAGADRRPRRKPRRADQTRRRRTRSSPRDRGTSPMPIGASRRSRPRCATPPPARG